jgi:hypothetical protein
MISDESPQPSMQAADVPPAVVSDDPTQCIEPLFPSITLSRYHLPRLADFTCSFPGRPETRWEQDVSEWIKSQPGDGGAIDDVELNGGKVWLYPGPDERFLGFGSLGFQTVEWPNRKTTIELVIPGFAVSTHVRGDPNVPIENRPGWRIFKGLIEEARTGEKWRGHSWLYLDVDPENPARAGIYSKFRFKEVFQYIDPVTGREWVLMRCPLEG